MYIPTNPLGTLIFDTVDTLGKRVVLEKDRFTTHIIDGHANMSGNEKAIQEIIENPEYIVADKYFPDRTVYIGTSTQATIPTKPIKTVVDQNAKDGYGFIVTSYFLKNVNTEGAKIIYDKKTIENKL